MVKVNSLYKCMKTKFPIHIYVLCECTLILYNIRTLYRPELLSNSTTKDHLLSQLPRIPYFMVFCCLEMVEFYVTFICEHIGIINTLHYFHRIRTKSGLTENLLSNKLRFDSRIISR